MTMTQWEYMAVQVAIQNTPLNVVVTKLNEAGAEGWELIGMSPNVFYMKRPLQEVSEPILNDPPEPKEADPQ